MRGCILPAECTFTHGHANTNRILNHAARLLARAGSWRPQGPLSANQMHGNRPMPQSCHYTSLTGRDCQTACQRHCSAQCPSYALDLACHMRQLSRRGQMGRHPCLPQQGWGRRAPGLPRGSTNLFDDRTASPILSQGTARDTFVVPTTSFVIQRHWFPLRCARCWCLEAKPSLPEATSPGPGGRDALFPHWAVNTVA